MCKMESHQMYILEHNLIIDKKHASNLSFKLHFLIGLFNFLHTSTRKLLKSLLQRLEVRKPYIGFEQQTNCQESNIFQKKRELFLILYVLANNLHNVQDAFIYYERQTAGENLNILQLDGTQKKKLKKKKLQERNSNSRSLTQREAGTTTCEFLPSHLSLFVKYDQVLMFCLDWF